MLLKETDGLRLAVFDDLELFLAESVDGFALAAGDNDVDDDLAGGGFERGLISRGCLRRKRFGGKREQHEGKESSRKAWTHGWLLGIGAHPLDRNLRCKSGKLWGVKAGLSVVLGELPKRGGGQLRCLMCCGAK